MEDQEKQLLKLLAEAYAFISDLREAALVVGTTWVAKRTEGIDRKIAEISQAYPQLFQRHLLRTKRRVRGELLKEDTDGKTTTQAPPKKEVPAFQRPTRKPPGPTRGSLE